MVGLTDVPQPHRQWGEASGPSDTSGLVGTGTLSGQRHRQGQVSEVAVVFWQGRAPALPRADQPWRFAYDAIRVWALSSSPGRRLCMR